MRGGVQRRWCFGVPWACVHGWWRGMQSFEKKKKSPSVFFFVGKYVYMYKAEKMGERRKCIHNGFILSSFKKRIKSSDRHFRKRNDIYLSIKKKVIYSPRIFYHFFSSLNLMLRFPPHFPRNSQSDRKKKKKGIDLCSLSNNTIHRFGKIIDIIRVQARHGYPTVFRL